MGGEILKYIQTPIIADFISVEMFAKTNLI